MYYVQFMKLGVAFVCNNKTAAHLRKEIHDINIGNSGCCDVDKIGKISFDIKQGMKFYFSSLFPELSLPKDTLAKVYGS